MSHPEKQTPPRITVTQKEQYLEIVYARPVHSLTPVFIYFIGMFLFITTVNSFSLPLSLFFFIPFLLWCGVVYYSLCLRFNKIHLFITPTKLIVRYKPLFQGGNKEIPLSHINLISNDTKISFNKNLNKEESVTEVKVVKYGGRTETLFTAPSVEDAEYIQQKIMAYLAE